MCTKKALVLDDEPLNRKLFADVMDCEGVEAKTYSDPEEYRQANGGCLCKGDPCPCHDFMLIDNHMPHMSGLDFFRKLEEKGCQLNKKRKAIISGNWTDSSLQEVRDD